MNSGLPVTGIKPQAELQPEPGVQITWSFIDDIQAAESPKGSQQ
jgi:hypothetical protein